MRPVIPLLLVLWSATAFAEERASWSLSDSKSQGLHELNYGKPETDGEVYMRCTAGSGWIFIIHDYEPTGGNRQVKLAAGTASISPSFRVEHDGEIADRFYVDLAIPANHEVLKSFASGHPLRFDFEVAYPVGSEAERLSIRKFIGICDQRSGSQTS